MKIFFSILTLKHCLQCTMIFFLNTQLKIAIFFSILILKSTLRNFILTSEYYLQFLWTPNLLFNFRHAQGTLKNCIQIHDFKKSTIPCSDEIRSLIERYWKIVIRQSSSIFKMGDSLHASFSFLELFSDKIFFIIFSFIEFL